jgi:hypothetical protein
MAGSALRGPFQEACPIVRVPALLFVLAAPLTLVGAASAQTAAPPLAARLSADRLSDVEPGLYTAGDERSFTLQPYGDRMLLKFADSGESFVLTVERASLGAKLLKYDTGATALRVSVWGGLTLYTQADPSGLPATRQGDAPDAPELPPVTAAQLRAALSDLAAHLDYTQKIELRFAADPVGDDPARQAAFETLSNTGRGIERFVAAAPAAHKALAARLETVKIAPAAHPGVSIQGRSLQVGFTPGQGPAGYPSSHAVAHALGKLLAVATAE